MSENLFELLYKDRPNILNLYFSIAFHRYLSCNKWKFVGLLGYRDRSIG